ncbi:type II toxin-antitoxin system VapC family toxin [Amycolatopsis acidicola]|uniref:Type II toxin-antitoxin system VapC family toxin n=1 Tax=Amycolatopsis acidicola TaxID=2596893 RepID=A0A5N0UN29_9PSEU|nr:type II toxin-antitoxin system VapC family toxin [Amycolatopsis acidicola]KAA9148513.1 type II toxin-antitoxin system VapC family toxin [Amycolatopsis acidicola]
MAERPEAGVLDTCTYLDLTRLDPAVLPQVPEITAITLAELHQGVAMARDAEVRAARTEQLGAALAEFEPLPFDGPAAARFGTLVSLTLAAGRRPKPRLLDLQIAAIASVHGLPLYTRNAGDFKGLEKMLKVVAL